MNATLAPRKTRVSTALLYAGFALFYLFLAAMIPYTHDDWDWGLPIGMQHLLTADINSRYAGNLIEVIMTRSFLAKTLIMAACYFMIPWLLATFIQRLTGQSSSRKPLFFLMSNFLVLAMGAPMWQQTYGWIAGFANFGLSSVFMLLCLMQMLPLFQDTPVQKPSVLKTITFFIVSLIGQLFLENLALFMVIIAIISCIVYYIKYKRLHPTYVAISLGSLIGLGIMFSSAIYSSMLSTGAAVDGVRTLSFSFSDSIGKILYDIFYQAMRLAQRGGQFRCTNIVILALLGIAAVRSCCKGKKLCLICNSLLILFNLIADLLPEEGALWILIGGGMSIVLYGLIAAEVVFLFREQKAMRRTLLSLLLCAFSLILPFLAIGENGPRIFFPSYMFLVLFALTLTNFVLLQNPSNTEKHLFRGALCLSVATVLVLGWCYTQIGICTSQRYALIQQAIAENQQTITLPQYPYEDLVWKPDAGEERIGYFKDFYHIPDHITVIFESLEK